MQITIYIYIYLYIFLSTHPPTSVFSPALGRACKNAIGNGKGKAYRRCPSLATHTKRVQPNVIRYSAAITAYEKKAAPRPSREPSLAAARQCVCPDLTHQTAEQLGHYIDEHPTHPGSEWSGSDSAHVVPDTVSL